MSRRINALVLVTCVLLGAPFSANAQQLDENNNSKLRSDCEAYVRGIHEGADTLRRMAFVSLSRCPQSGPKVLVEEWKTPPTNRIVFVGLIAASSNTADKRLLRQLSVVANDSSHAPEIRIGAMAVMGSYINRQIRGGPTEDPKKRHGFITTINTVPRGLTERKITDFPLGEADIVNIALQIEALSKDSNSEIATAGKIILTMFR